MQLYDSLRSPNARKVRLLAKELGIEIEPLRLDFAAGAYRTPEYLAKNPNGKVPTLVDGDFVLWESAAILRYLAAQKPERGFAPTDPRAQAQIDQWLFWWTAHPEAALWQLVDQKLIKPFRGLPGHDPAIVGQAQSELARFLPILDGQLTGRPYVLGELSVVDFAIAPFLEASDRVGIDLRPYAAIAAWIDRLRARPYWIDG